MKELKDEIRLIVAEGNLKAAIKWLLKHFDRSDELNEIIVQSGRYHDLQRMNRHGTISDEAYQQDLNRLRLNVLNYVDAISEESLVQDPKLSLKSLVEEYKGALARIKVIELLEKDEAGMTIKELHEQSGLKQRKYLIFSLDELIDAGIVERFRLEKRSLNRLTTKGRDFVKSLK